ncbi:MAG: DUF3862 domain-containing protein [Gammaproteobacteria bacterium]|nr:DUF3862 domain-containing protein [Gammaproteobacteria bacterium]
MKDLKIFPMLALCALLLACGSPINEDNFDKIQVGMSEMEVINILGEPADTSNMTIGPVSGTSSVWESEHARISIQFLNGKVKVKNFTKPGQK